MTGRVLLSEVALPSPRVQGSLYFQCRRQPDTVSCLLRKPVCCWDLVMQATEKQCMLCSGLLVVLSNPSSSSHQGRCLLPNLSGGVPKPEGRFPGEEEKSLGSSREAVKISSCDHRMVGSRANVWPGVLVVGSWTWVPAQLCL